MFFGGNSAPDRKVTLRGSSKQQDRTAVLERAAREREARQVQRVRQRSATLLQSAHRRRAARRALSARERAGWDALMQRAQAARSTPAVVPAIGALVRAVLVFDGSQPMGRADAARRAALCELVLSNAAEADARVNRCALMCSLDTPPADARAVSPATAWFVQCRGLVRACSRAVTAAVSAGGGEGAALSAVSSELRLLAYLTDASAWAWRGLLPSEAHALRASEAAHRLALRAGGEGAHEAAWGPVQAAGTRPLSLGGGTLALCALSLRALRAPAALGSAPESAESAAQAARFASAALCLPGLVARLPAPLSAQLCADERLLAHLLGALCAGRGALLASLGPAPPAGAPPSGGAAAGVSEAQRGARVGSRGAHAASPLAPMAFLGNVISLAHVLLVAAPAASAAGLRPGAGAAGEAAAGEAVLRSALGAYVQILSAALRPWVDAHMAQGERRALPGSAGSDSDSDDDDDLGGAGGGRGASAPCAMDVDAEGGAAPVSAEHASLVDRQLRALVAGAHASALFAALLPATAADAQRARGAELGALSALSPLYCLLLAHGSPLAARLSPSASSGAQSAVLLLSSLCFSAGVAPRLWAVVSAGAAALGGSAAAWASPSLEGPLCLFCQLANHALIVLSDDELLGPAQPLHAAGGAAAGAGAADAAAGAACAADADAGRRTGGAALLPREQLRSMCLALKELAVHLFWSAEQAAAQPLAPFGASADPLGSALSASSAMAGGAPGVPLSSLLRVQLTRLLTAMHQRDSRRPFIGDRLAWLAGGSASGKAATIMALVQAAPAPQPTAASERASAAPPAQLSLTGAAESERAMALLRSMPFALPFEGRLAALRAWVWSDRQSQGFDLHHLWPQPIRVRRAAMLADSFAALRGASSQLKLPLRVQFFNEQGLEEAGIGEGVMKEYLVELIRAACSPDARLFAATAEGELYPDPQARHALSDSSSLFEFVGAMFAKSLYEGILLDVPLAPFFLAKVLGTTNTVNDLPALDPQLHRNLLFLKSYAGPVEDLALCYAVTDKVGGRECTTDLKPNGRNIPVTSADRTEYVFLVANYRLNAQLRRPCAAFLRGFTSVIPASWIAMFSPRELAMVLSGSDAPIDVADWRAHARYASGYHDQHPAIRSFWQVVGEMRADQRAAVLRFATSSARPPLLGFKWLAPPFCIQMASVSEEGRARLPTSATCMNLLKLPPYEDLDTMRAKLTYAVNAGCGFDLS